MHQLLILPLFVHLGMATNHTSTLPMLWRYLTHVLLLLKQFYWTPLGQQALSSKLDDLQFCALFNVSSVADRARLLSISAPHSSSWLSVVPSEGLGLHFEPNQYHVALWLRHFRWLTVFPLPRFHPGSPRPPCYHMQTTGGGGGKMLCIMTLKCQS